MSEQQNTALVQSLYAAFGRGDLEAILDHCAEDVEWTLEGPAILPFAGKRRGRAQVKEFFMALATTQNNRKLTTETFVAQGNHVATAGRYSANVTATGKSFDSAVAHLFTIRDGKISKFLDFVDSGSMAEAYTSASAAAR